MHHGIKRLPSQNGEVAAESERRGESQAMERRHGVKAMKGYSASFMQGRCTSCAFTLRRLYLVHPSCHLRPTAAHRARWPAAAPEPGGAVSGHPPKVAKAIPMCQQHLWPP